MCGILAFTAPFEDIDAVREAVKRRGPDYYGTHESSNFVIESSVLAIRSPLAPQPVVTEFGTLGYNGEVYVPFSDTKYVSELCSSNRFADLMRTDGEFAFVYQTNNTVYFARDAGGRRSLLYRVKNGELAVTSVSLSPEFTECLAGGALYRFDLTTRKLTIEQIDVPKFQVSQTLVAPMVPLAHELLSILKQTTKTRVVEERMGVLFSGGLDCAVLTALLDDVLPEEFEIELLNVAFENRRTEQLKNMLFDTPDRVLARRTVKELQKRSRFPNRLKLVEINVPYTEAVEHRPKVMALMSPTATVMDLSIALAFYFAARPSNSRVLLSGLGADELFGGYSRHTNAASKGPKMLAAELANDFLRLPSRNLGRDDRVLSNWGRELRYPFLDRSTVEFAMKCPLSTKTDGETTKILLREVAKILELDQVSTEKKRAIQFGARSAKMDPNSGKSRGVDQLPPGQG